jgi:hypothetical protein
VEGRRQKAESRRQKAEGRRQKAEGRKQKAEGIVKYFYAAGFRDMRRRVLTAHCPLPTAY